MEPTGESPKRLSLKDRLQNVSQKLTREKIPVDPEIRFREREEKLMPNTSQANLDERTQQAMIREIRDGNLTLDQKKVLYGKLDPIMKGSLPNPDPGGSDGGGGGAVLEDKGKLQSERDRLMDIMWGKPNEETQKKIREIDDQLEKRFGVVPLNKKLSRSTEVAPQTESFPKDRRHENLKKIQEKTQRATVIPRFTTDSDAVEYWSGEQEVTEDSEPRGPLSKIADRVKSFFGRG